MPSKDKDPIQLLQGTLDLIVLRTLATMGSQHAYQIATVCSKSLIASSISTRERCTPHW